VLRRIVKAMLAIVLVVTMFAVPGIAEVKRHKGVTHPLDPLTTEEIATAMQVLQQGGYTDAATRLPILSLHEPNKADVWAWKKGDKLGERRAFLVAKKGRQIYEGVVNVTKREVESWQEMKGVQAMIMVEDAVSAQEIVIGDARMREKLREHGVADLSKVVCTPLSAGYYGPSEYENERLLKVPCYLDTGDGNFWAHPIEGLLATVDLNKRAVVNVEDHGVLPIPKQYAGFHEPRVKKWKEQPAPLITLQPEGPSYRVDGNMVSWQNWKFHYRIDPREGLVISTVTYDDEGKERKVLYRGSMAGMLVPYGDPSPGWYFRAYMDAGEYGMGKLLTSQVRNADAPSHALFLDAVMADEQGKAYEVKNAVSIFERYANAEWRHFESLYGYNDARARRELVVRSVSTIGNYDYTFDWIFEQNGNIRIDVGASGIEVVKGVEARHLHDDPHGYETAHGTLVDEFTVAPHHQHIYNFRLDLDVDGEKNSFLRLEPKAVPVAVETPRKSGMIIEEKKFRTEGETPQKFNPMNIPLAYNPEVKNKQGYSVAYQVIPAAQGTHPFAGEPLFTPDDWIMKRAGFTKYHLWVTPYDPRQKYPEGDYPNQSKTETGLAKWVQENRSIENRDNVVWVTTGTTHIPRAEEWPIMPTEWASVLLKPFNFFDKTPTLGLPQEEQDE
jgi:primary-amine oxidase